jgi:hypothetical protein
MVDKVDNHFKMVSSTSAISMGLSWAVIVPWLQKEQSNGQPSWGTNMGIMACFFN